MATTNGSTAIRDKILASLARYRALRIGKFPCAFWRLSARPGLTAYEGWGREAKQLDEEGSSRGLILSLLFDHCLLLHPEQIARIESKLPAYTVGSLQRKSQMDVLLEFITSLLEFPDPGDKLKELGELIKDVFQLMPSGKHMTGRDLGRLGPTASLKYCSAG
ncbi:hypothetical protein [Bathymodiolus japonicus methanotrophic gill symbiont]|uniref:hypothetical protein n=1 Tax=Bathymodiolus japonicus methanotrophic gill symbiont TaxID=113269 RepID=UPI001C8D3D4A|nr:hypothetical protein [Bathymodiolus japonicus methanotrophic gill symbiont]